ncbi:MAG: hypothetical protein LBL41_04625 [Bifidobacteriaceae bacterium]|jgi:hypothetical protein|nr:hypothetical protein [Bifidobacteriaceae bacterium]
MLSLGEVTGLYIAGKLQSFGNAVPETSCDDLEDAKRIVRESIENIGVGMFLPATVDYSTMFNNKPCEVWKETDEFGTTFYYDDIGRFHRDDGMPAVIYADGREMYYKHGALHPRPTVNKKKWFKKKLTV